MSNCICPKCGSNSIEMQIMQENQGSTTKSVSKTKYKEKRHGCLWWLCIGWWWWMIDLFIWIFAFIPRVLLHIGRKKKYTGTTKSVSKTKNAITYKTVCICKDCGNNWIM